jgi:hypothetical protein
MYVLLYEFLSIQLNAPEGSFPKKLIDRYKSVTVPYLRIFLLFVDDLCYFIVGYL